MKPWAELRATIDDLRGKLERADAPGAGDKLAVAAVRALPDLIEALDLLLPKSAGRPEIATAHRIVIVRVRCAEVTRSRGQFTMPEIRAYYALVTPGSFTGAMFAECHKLGLIEFKGGWVLTPAGRAVLDEVLVGFDQPTEKEAACSTE